MSLRSQRPALAATEAQCLAERLYGLRVSATGLPSERDQNFLLRTDRDAFVLKVSGTDEPDAHLEMQNAVLDRLAAVAPALPVPRLRRAADGDPMPLATAADGRTHHVRLLTHLPGRTMAQVRPHAPGLLADLGRRLAELDAALEGFRHPAAQRDFVWDPARAPEIVAAHRDAVPRRRQSVLDRVLEQWRTCVAPHLGSLRRSVNYNDANDHNVLVATSDGAPQAVSGLIDFGDMLETCTVGDPAIAAAYAMLGKSDPLRAAAAVVAGYHCAFPLREDELEVLFPMAVGRLAVSVCLAAHRKHDEPDNAYLAVSEAPAWAALERLVRTHPRLARNTLRDACGLPPCPLSPGVTSWLETHRGTFSAILDPDPREASTTTLDLSVGTPDFPDADLQAGAAAFSASVFRLVADRGATIGIGRYDEPRLVYLTDAFTAPGGEHPERRTVHLGIDLFVESGTPVRAPLGGVVHAVRDNAAPLDYGPTVILRHEPSDGPTFFTLYGHLHPDCLRLELGAAVDQGEAFAQVGWFEHNGHWPPHLHFQIVTDLLDRDGEFPGVAAPRERDVWLSLSPDPNLVLGLGGIAHRAPQPTAEEILDARRQRLGRTLSVSYRSPLHIVRGRRQYLYDRMGRAYLDCVNNVCHVGHGHPRVVTAAARQMAVLNTNTRYLHEHIVRYAEELTATLPEPLRVCHFVCSGSEANELALRMARTHAGAEDLIVLEGGYHGNTQTLVDVSHYKFAGAGGRGAPPWVHAVAMPDDYRGPHRRDDPACATRYADYVRAAIDALARRDRRPAAFLSETMLSCGGQIELPPGYLAEAYEAVRTAGGVCIADEVQVGFGRLGTHFWGFQTQEVVPDIVTMGKPIGNGHPLAAVVTTPEIAASFDTGMEYFNTFGGNPVSCAIGLAVLDVIRDERLQAHALAVGQHLRKRLQDLQASHPIVGDVRGRGLFLGVEFVRDRDLRTPAAAEAAYVVERMKAHGILLSTDGPEHNVIKIKPPLVFDEADAERLVAVLDAVLGEDVPRLVG
jgi:4-aminobutyrate aminotransferase-like enzyme/Ser/Thr protein kinase RdoA (MazF antagonist)